jgi:post-segregation antitoxin (ccd killing protein)
MAIKGKGKTKPKQAARAPRREPVPVKPPFVQRGWVRALAAFLAGLAVLAVAWWAWENLDHQHNTKDAAAKLSLQREAVTAWGKGNLEPALTSVGQLQAAGAPQVATSVGTALDALKKGDDPGVKADDLTSLADKLDKAAANLDRFTLSDTIADHGFDPTQADLITTVQSEAASSLRSFAVADSLTARAIADPKDEDLAATAKEAYDTGQTLVQRAWNSYINISTLTGVPIQAQQGLPTGG